MLRITSKYWDFWDDAGMANAFITGFGGLAANTVIGCVLASASADECGEFLSPEIRRHMVDDSDRVVHQGGYLGRVTESSSCISGAVTRW